MPLTIIDGRNASMEPFGSPTVPLEPDHSYKFVPHGSQNVRLMRVKDISDILSTHERRIKQADQIAHQRT